MVGGKISLVQIIGDRARVVVQGEGIEAHDQRQIYVEHAGEPLAVGDDIWWQAGWALWTPT